MVKMKHKEHKGKALCNALNHSMNLVRDWKDVDCKRCLKSKRRVKDMRKNNKEPDYKGFCEEFEERVERGFPIEAKPGERRFSIHYGGHSSRKEPTQYQEISLISTLWKR